ncbi:MAG: hypothetical protein HFE62_05000 [Firmicutes bacterium]|nr:hypothetical protein [Bacillota bacterium]
MIYELNGGLKEIEISKISSGNITVGIVPMSKFEENRDIFGVSNGVVAECRQSSKSAAIRSSIDVYDDMIFGIINIVDIRNIWAENDRAAFLIKKNLFLLVDIVDRDKSICALFDSAVHKINAEDASLECVIYSILESLIRDDVVELEETEFEISAMEEEITAGNTNRVFTAEMLAMKKKLLMLHNYYEQLVDIGEELNENRNGVFDGKKLHCFKLFAKKAGRLSRNVERQRENIVQLWQANQANMDYSLNCVIKMFTVVTTVFMPLTLIAGWYGMNFEHMPELSWKYGYAMVIVLSTIVVAFCVWFFKKKNLF